MTTTRKYYENEFDALRYGGPLDDLCDLFESPAFASLGDLDRQCDSAVAHIIWRATLPEVLAQVDASHPVTARAQAL